LISAVSVETVGIGVTVIRFILTLIDIVAASPVTLVTGFAVALIEWYLLLADSVLAARVAVTLTNVLTENAVVKVAFSFESVFADASVIGVCDDLTTLVLGA